ncbi:hypothetical protein [Priestia megaterium]|uniref:hypothetical protein n=1 Tax=Priestia megaterium TaxID=1404 RepID=UPI002E22AB33|nr:hypothetical protein [Priestia megaterium]
MKLKVEQIFRDKNTDKVYQIGDVIEVDEARGEELLANSLNLVSVVADEKPKKTTAKKTVKKS